jgi:hypothetical protein
MFIGNHHSASGSLLTLWYACCLGMLTGLNHERPASNVAANRRRLGSAEYRGWIAGTKGGFQENVK